MAGGIFLIPLSLLWLLDATSPHALLALDDIRYLERP